MPKFTEARLKIARARQHLADVNARLLAFVKETPQKVIAERDEHRAVWRFIFHGGPAPDPMTGVVCGEVVQSLRTALDYAVAELIVSATGTWPSSKTMFEFPIFINPEAYAAAAPAKLKGVAAEAQFAIEHQQPYKIHPADPAKTYQWALHRLNIEDKHRRLHVLSKGIILWRFIGTGRDGEMEIDQRNQWIYPLEDGSEVATIPIRDSADTFPHMQPDIKFEICFDNPDEAKGSEVGSLLRRSISEVEGMLDALEPFAN